MIALTPSRLSDLLERHRINPSRRLGQHFLTDPNLVGKMVRTAGVRAGDNVIEVGAGVGNLTAALAEAGARVRCYEIDGRLAPVLAETLADYAGRVEIRIDNAMKVDWEAELEGNGWIMVSNLPYGVGTPLLMEMVQRVPAVARFVVMLQREVVMRLQAGPGSAEYGLPSVVAALHTEVRRAFDVPPQVFHPRPEVVSSVVELRRIRPHRHASMAVFLASQAFRQRRKMLRRSLASALAAPETMLTGAGISPDLRPEALSPADFLRLAEVVKRLEDNS